MEQMNTRRSVRNRTATLIRKGQIPTPRKDCAHCGTVQNVVLHHNSYLVADDVMPLCKSHHRAWHLKNVAPGADMPEWGIAERQQVTAWLLPQEYALLRRECERAGKSIADVLREAIQRMLETIEAPDAQ